jgi:hypothetical protein
MIACLANSEPNPVFENSADVWTLETLRSGTIAGPLLLRCYLEGAETVIYDGLPSIEQQDSSPHRKK